MLSITRKPVTKSRKLRALEKEILERGYATHDEIDVLLSNAKSSAAFEVRIKQLVKLLADVNMHPAPRTPSTRGCAGMGRWEYLLRGVARNEPLTTYVREIGSIPQTEREDEVRLGRRLEFMRARFRAKILAAGVSNDIAEEILDSSRIRPLVDAAGSNGLAAHLPRGAAGDAVRKACKEYSAVREEFIERNLHLVVAAATPYRTYGVPLLDLIQEGNAGLIRAVEKFDWRKEVRFRTYSALWIRQAIERAIASNKGIVRVPNYMQQKIRRLRREGRLPRAGQEASASDVSQAFGLSHEVAGHLLETQRASRSLDQGMGEDGEAPLADALAAKENDAAILDWEQPLLKSRIIEALSSLSEQERTILMCRYGLGSDETMTLEEVGKKVNVSRERVRQLQIGALRKLQAPNVKARLSQFV